MFVRNWRSAESKSLHCTMCCSYSSTIALYPKNEILKPLSHGKKSYFSLHCTLPKDLVCRYGVDRSRLFNERLWQFFYFLIIRIIVFKVATIGKIFKVEYWQNIEHAILEKYCFWSFLIPHIKYWVFPCWKYSHAKKHMAEPQLTIS